VNSGTNLQTFATNPLFPTAGCKTVTEDFHQTAWHQIPEDGLILQTVSPNCASETHLNMVEFKYNPTATPYHK
jgi:hypothetical protein